MIAGGYVCHRAELDRAHSCAQSEPASHDSSVGACMSGAGEGVGGRGK